MASTAAPNEPGVRVVLLAIAGLQMRLDHRPRVRLGFGRRLLHADVLQLAAALTAEDAVDAMALLVGHQRVRVAALGSQVPASGLGLGLQV